MKRCRRVLGLRFLGWEHVTGGAAVSAHGQHVVGLADLEGGILGEHPFVSVSQVDAQDHLGHGGQVLEVIEA